MGGGIEEVFGKRYKRFVAHLLNESVHGHCTDELFVADCFAIFEGDHFSICVDFLDSAMRAKHSLFFRYSVGNGDPDGACPAVCWETEGGVGSPVTGGPLHNDVLRHSLNIRSSDTLTQPLALHLKSVRQVFALHVCLCSPLWLVLPRL